jgi:hypothetical protein
MRKCTSSHGDLSKEARREQGVEEETAEEWMELFQELRVAQPKEKGREGKK